MLDGSGLVVRMTHDTPADTRVSVTGSDVQLYCQSGPDTGPGVSTDSGPIERWPEGRPELHLSLVSDYSKLPHPVCGVRVPNGIPFAAATF